MNEEIDVSSYLVKLRRLWKGTLYIGLAAIYVFLVIAAFVLAGLYAALFALALIVLAHVFRYVADEVDRIGWVIRANESDDAEVTKTLRLRRVLLFLLVPLVKIPIVVLIGFAYTYLAVFWANVCLILLVFGELLFLEMRRVNRQVAYRDASFGRHYGNSMLGAIETPVSNATDDAELRDRLANLEALLKDGKISLRAFEKARDKYWVRHVMEGKR